MEETAEHMETNQSHGSGSAEDLEWESEEEAEGMGHTEERTGEAPNKDAPEGQGAQERKAVWEMSRDELSREWSAWARDKHTANRWHDRRRAKILNAHKDVAHLFGAEPLTPFVMLALAGLHVSIAVSGTLGSVPLAVLLAATVGGLLSFDLQALNHELMHQFLAAREASGYLPQGLRRLAYRVVCGPEFSHLAGLLGSMCTAIPWFAYYFAGGHQFHHNHAGTPYDNDGDALFWAWESVPRKLPFLNSPVGSVLWISLVSLVLPVIYFLSLGYWFIKCPVANATEMLYATVDSCCTIALHYFVFTVASWPGIVYLYLSSAFSMGFLFHPLLAFWISQHWCKIDRKKPLGSMMQPTLSFYGSPLWNWLTMNELLHVEHHDFSRIPWTRLHRLQEIAPEFYTASHIVTLKDLFKDLLLPWLFKKDLKFDFACRRAALEVPYNPFAKFISQFTPSQDEVASASKKSESLRKRLLDQSESA